jgi:hypothetical protein
MGAPRTPPAQVPSWFAIAGVLFGALTLGFFMYLVLTDKIFPCDKHFFIVVVFSFGTALSSSFLGGSATAKGQLPISPQYSLAVSTYGGIGVLVTCLALGYVLYVKDCIDPKPIVVQEPVLIENGALMLRFESEGGEDESTPDKVRCLGARAAESTFQVILTNYGKPVAGKEIKCNLKGDSALVARLNMERTSITDVNGYAPFTYVVPAKSEKFSGTDVRFDFVVGETRYLFSKSVFCLCDASLDCAPADSVAAIPKPFDSRWRKKGSRVRYAKAGLTVQSCTSGDCAGPGSIQLAVKLDNPKDTITTSTGELRKGSTKNDFEDNETYTFTRGKKQFWMEVSLKLDTGDKKNPTRFRVRVGQDE